MYIKNTGCLSTSIIRFLSHINSIFIIDLPFYTYNIIRLMNKRIYLRKQTKTDKTNHCLQKIQKINNENHVRLHLLLLSKLSILNTDCK